MVQFASRSLIATACLAVFVELANASPAASAESGSKTPGASTTGFSPYAGRQFPTRLLFGDTHHHTANSGDAFMNGDRLMPDDAYRLARGEELLSSSGVPVKLSRPLDFLVISDHAEGLGVMTEVYKGNPAFVADPTLARWSKMMQAGGKQAAAATNELISAQAQGVMPGPVQDPATIGPVMKSVWQQYTKTAERFNEPGTFTALIGYEWSSVPGGNNLHRNIIFRDGKKRADQVFPFSSWQSEDPERLWDWMSNYEAKTGGRVLAIPHNGNLSNGRMFELQDFSATGFDRRYAERRARFERLQEIVQTKGNSETHPTLSPNDEFAGDLGVAGWDFGNLTLQGAAETSSVRATMYLRAGLQRGLEEQARLGANPFKFGLIGGTDVHTSLSAIEEDNFFGKHVVQEPGPDRWKHIAKQGLGKTRYTWHYLAAGYAAVWATDNTREAIWDAMYRREVYATSGSRILVRFFGGWNFTDDDANSRYIADVGYRKGVPMGADLARRKGASAPSFLIAAQKDPKFGNLDRIQVVKAWLDEDGIAHERVYDAAWSSPGTRQPGADGKIPPVGNTVDVARATWVDSIGEPSLSTTWTDPDFIADQPALYYARVIEIPTPRWTAYDALRFGIEMDPQVPMSQQERAWTSPIWYTP